jgi:DMSO/TMAO reductase YedYZ molybdopterin-dependent catalytic subunit
MTAVMPYYSNTSEPSPKMKKRALATALIILAVAISGTAYGIMQMRPQAQGSTGRLLVHGLVQNSLNITMNEIHAMPKTVVNEKLVCVDFPGAPIANGNWTGVQLAYLLQQAKVNQTAIKVAFYADDGYTTDLTIQDALNESIIIAYELNGKPLAEGLRLVVPGRWGYKWISHLATIELVDFDFKGTWENRGYPDPGIITQN